MKPLDDAASVDSNNEKKFKMHFRKISAKALTEADWKKLCVKNFDFVRQEIESLKDQKISAAKLAAMHDLSEYNLDL